MPLTVQAEALTAPTSLSEHTTTANIQADAVSSDDVIDTFLSRGKPVSSSHEFETGYPIENIVDGNIENSGAAKPIAAPAEETVFITFDLEDIYEIKRCV